MREWLLRCLVALVIGILSGTVTAGEGEWYEHPKEYLTIVVKSVSKHYQDLALVDSDTISCDIEALIKFPVISSGPSQTVVDSLNGFLSTFVMEHCELEPGATMEERVEAEWNSIITYWKDRQSSLLGSINWEVEIAYCDHSILSLRLIESTCLSCNGNPYHEYTFHFALPNLAPIPEDSIFTAGSQPYLDSIGELAFREYQRIPADIHLHDLGYDFDDGKFALCSNFVILDSGLMYVFNTYTIASGATGMSFASLTWEQLRPIIRPDGPFSWVLRQE